MTTLYISTDREGYTYTKEWLTPGATFVHEPGEYSHIPVSWNVGLKEAEVVPYMMPLFQNDPWDTASVHTRIWKCEGTGQIHDDGLRVCATEIKVLEEYTFPPHTPTQARAFAVACAITAFPHPEFTQWATKWLAGLDENNQKARTLRDNLYQEVNFEFDGRNVAASALAAVMAPDHSDGENVPSVYGSPGYYAAAAGWNLHTMTDGKVSLVPAVRFASQFSLERMTLLGTISESSTNIGDVNRGEPQPA